MSNLQLYLAIGVPSLVNIGMITFLYLALSRRIDDLKELMDEKFARVYERLDSLDRRVKALEDARSSGVIGVR
jgi:hypothetical protein